MIVLKKQPLLPLLLAVLVCLTIASASLRILSAQENSVTLSVAIPENRRELFSDALIKAFEAAYPGVKLNVVSSGVVIPSAVDAPDKHLEALEKYARTADVLYVDPVRISPEGTRAGYFLDLTTLVNDDSKLKTDDFYPALWQSFQWDKAIWALPTATNVIVLTYSPGAFDKAGLAYPSDKWTLDDLDNAVRKLAQKDNAGKVTLAGIDIFSDRQPYLFRSLLKDSLFDSSTIPNTPRLAFAGPDALLNTWNKLIQEGLIGRDLNKAPMSVGSAFDTLLQVDSEQKRVATLLPGGKAGLEVQGFAISRGTQNPDKAYALAAFLTTRAEIASRFGLSAARKSLMNAEPGDNQTVSLTVPQEIRALIDQGLANGIPFAEMRYTEYLNRAMDKMRSDGLDAMGALQAVEVDAVKAQRLAAEKRQDQAQVVATPIPSANVAPDKVNLKFGLGTLVTPLPNRDAWDQAIKDFVASDPQVGSIALSIGIDPLERATQQNDCFYVPYNMVPGAKLDLLLNVDPFLTADASFDKADVIGGVMPQLQRDNKTWAVPIAIDPAILKYNSDKFDKAGVPAPASGWTIDAFASTVKSLKPTADDKAPFVAANTGGTHLLILIAAYGGMPQDYRTNPVTINYTDPANVDAIRQVLDLAKQGYIKYDPLGNFNFGFGTLDRTATLYTDTLNTATAASSTDATKSDPYKVTIYPRGSKFAALSYTIGAAYISARSQNPEACYRWISALAKRPDLFASMPARRSQIKDPALAAVQGQDVIALYSQIDQLLQDPATITFPSVYSGGESLTGFLLQYWLYQVFDKYVLQNGDLESMLKTAETNAKAFQGCAANLPPLDESSPAAAREYYKKFGECATKIDPSLGLLFALIK